jgi:signal transduction histidine kinase
MTVAWVARIGRADVLLTGATFAVAVLAAFLMPHGWLDGKKIDGFAVLLLALMTLPVLFRRAWPLAALVGCVVLQVIYHAMDYAHDITLPSAVVLLYAVARSVARPRILVVVAGLGFIVVLVVGLTDDGPPGTEVILPLGWFLAAAVAGQAVRFHHAYFTEVSERRVAEERLRIARDLHDVLAHNIVVINTHAGVAAHLLGEPDPELAPIAESLRTVAQASSTALAELRTTLDVLRSNDSDRQPVPGLGQLDDLAESTRAAGVEVSVEVRGVPRALGPTVEVTLYRIAQEALTNVVKHAKAEHAMVCIVYDEHEVRLEVTDDGWGAAGSGGGYGIVGMTERAGALGGRLVAGSLADGGYRVAATLPTSVRTPGVST